MKLLLLSYSFVLYVIRAVIWPMILIVRGRLKKYNNTKFMRIN